MVTLVMDSTAIKVEMSRHVAAAMPAIRPVLKCMLPGKTALGRFPAPSVSTKALAHVSPPTCTTREVLCGKIKKTMWGIAVLCALLVAVEAAGKGCNGQPNTMPALAGTLVHVSTVEDAQLFKVTTVVPNLLVAHIWGKAGRARGRAYGRLLKPYLRLLYDSFFRWVEENVEEAVIKYIPKDLAELLAVYGVDGLLDMQYLLMRGHMSDDFREEMAGVAEESGLTYAEVARVVVFPDLVKAACTIVGAWGSATAPEYSASLVQLRALDWATNSPIQQWPLVTVYHTDRAPGSAFATLGWPLFLGALSGMSSSPVAICEKVYLSYKGKYRRNGVPITLMLRDILEFDSSVQEALARMEAAKRTCSIWVGVGAPTSPERFTIVEYARDYVRHFNDSNLQSDNPQHPQLSDIVYVDKHVQPSGDPCLGSLLQEAHGAITPASMVAIAGALKTGDTHAAIYDFLNMRMLVSNASPFVNGSCVPAYNRQFVSLDMRALFAQQQ
jgi:hypothetical protein